MFVARCLTRVVYGLAWAGGLATLDNMKFMRDNFPTPYLIELQSGKGEIKSNVNVDVTGIAAWDFATRKPTVAAAGGGELKSGNQKHFPPRHILDCNGAQR
jgi:hypothetical protein